MVWTCHLQSASPYIKKGPQLLRPKKNTHSRNSDDFFDSMRKWLDSTWLASFYNRRLCPTSPKVSPGHFRLVLAGGWKGSCLRFEGGSDCLLLDFGLKIRNPNMIRYRWRSAMKDDFRFGVTTVRMIPSKSQDFWKVDGRNPANQSIPRRSHFHRVLYIPSGAGFFPSTVVNVGIPLDQSTNPLRFTS